jgi:hypothetical protein
VKLLCAVSMAQQNSISKNRQMIFVGFIALSSIRQGSIPQPASSQNWNCANAMRTGNGIGAGEHLSPRCFQSHHYTRPWLERDGRFSVNGCRINGKSKAESLQY